MGVCLELDGGLEKGCKPLVAGTKDLMILIPLESIAGVAYHATKKKVITDLTLLPGKKGFAFAGYNNSTAFREDIVPGKYSLYYKHELDLVAFDASPEAQEIMEAVNSGRYVAVVETNNQYFKVLGLNAGMAATKNATDSGDKDTGGANLPTLVSDSEIGYGAFLQKFTTGATPVYDYTATKAAFMQLLVAQP